jgi:single-strand DNA-binding protein
MSTATITGRLTSDSEMRFLPSGVAQLTFSVADNHRKKQGDDWVDDGASFWRVTLWRQDAETYVELLTKGTEVVVTGEPRIREFEGRDGTKGKSAEIDRATVGIRKRPARVGGTPAPRSTGADDPWATPAQGSTNYSDEPPF